MGLDDLGKAVNSYKKWFTSITDKADIYINDAIESMGDPFKYNGLTNNLRKSSINNLTDYLNDIQGFKESSIKQINSAFERAQKVNGDIIDEIKPLYQQALDKINASMENVSIYEQQLTGLKNVEKYKEGTKAFNRGFNNVREEYLVRQEMEIEDIWDRDSKAQQKLYNDMNKRYTQTYHPEIDNTSGYYYSDQNSAFLNDDALKQYETLKQMAPDMIITEQSYDWETDIDRAHELALRENNQFDFVRQAKEREKRRVNNRTTAQSQVNNSTATQVNNSTATQVNNSTATQSQTNTTQNQVNREPKKRRKSYADRTTKPINSDFNNAYYGQYDAETGTNKYIDYKSHYSGGVSRSNYDEEWIWSKQLGDTPDVSEYGIESPWSTNRVQTDVPTPPPESAVNVANNMPTPIDDLNKLLNKNSPEERMWVNRNFVFGDNYINNKDFNRTVTEFYTNTENAGKLFEKIAKFSDLEFSPNDFKIYENMFDTYKKATGQTTKDVQQQIINQFKEWKVSPKETQKHFRLIKEAAEEVGWQGNYEHLDYSSFKIDDVIETRKKPKLENADKSYRPEVKIEGNNIEIDSIYNHSIPKRVNKNNASQPETTVPERSTRRPLTAEEQAAVDKANAQWRADKEAHYAEMEKQINDMYKADDELYGSPEDILNPNYKSKFEPIEETTKETIKNQKEIDANNTKIKNETIEKLNKTKQMYEDILTDWTSASGDFNRQINTRTVGPHNIYAEGKRYLDDIEDLKNNYNVDDYVDGSYTMEQEVFKYSEGKGIDGKDVLKIEGDLVDAPNAYASDLNKTLEEAKKTMSPEDYQRYKNNFDVEGALVKTETGRTKLNRKKIVRNKAGLLDDIGKPGAIMTGLNILGAVGDYKDARRKGHGVISSAARTGVQFAVGEALGLWAIPVMAAKEVPGLVMKGAETLYKENRRMNSAANFQTFGDVQFQDTQQLATMRQSGMEMAKMSQYNLQQTLMGNEATYLHR